MKRVRKYNKQKCSQLRGIIENHVVAHNTILRQKIRFMTLDILLANCHPLDRKEFAKQLFDNCELDEKTAKYYLGNYVNTKVLEDDDE